VFMEGIGGLYGGWSVLVRCVFGVLTGKQMAGLFLNNCGICLAT